MYLGLGKYILCSIILINTTSTCIIKCFGFDAKISNGISLRHPMATMKITHLCKITFYQTTQVDKTNAFL